jgi:hypothetical protein
MGFFMDVHELFYISLGTKDRSTENTTNPSAGD